MGTLHFINPSGVPPAAEEPDVDSDKRFGKTSRVVIFLVEEDIDDRNYILQTLARSPYVHNVHWFENGDGVFTHLAHESQSQYTPALVLLGVRDAGDGGMQTLRRLRADERTRTIPVIIMADRPCDDIAKECLAQRASAFMVKPLCLERLHEVLLAN